MNRSTWSLPRRVVAALGATVASAALVAAPALGTAGTAQAADTKTLTIALTQEIDSLNPFQAYFSSSTQIGRLMYDFLTAYDAKDTHPIGGVADKWSYTPDKKTWTFHIADGHKWSDNTPVTAKDVAFTYNLIMTDEDAAKANGNFVANFKTVVAKDDHTLVITTKAPQATMLALDIPIVPEHVWKGQSPKDYKPEDHTPAVGDGPFILTDYKAGQFVKMKANEDYWRGAPKIDQLVFKQYSNPDAAVQALQKGEVDLISGINAAQTSALEKDDNITINKAQGKRFTELSLNSGAETTKGAPMGDGHPALKDKRVRQAIAMAVDKKTIIDKVLRGYAEPAEGYLPALYKTYHWDPSPEQKITFDLKKANQILDQAGYKKGSDGIRRMPGNGEKLNLRFEGHNDDPEELQIGNYLKSWFKQIGIGLTPTVVSSTKLNDDLPKGKWDLLMGGWTVNPDPDYVLNIQRCDTRPTETDGSSTTDQYYCDKKYDELYDKQLSTFDQAKRAELVKQMQQVMYEDIPSIMIDYPQTVEAYRSDRWKPFQTQPDPGGRILGQDGFWGIYSADPKESSGSGNGATIGITVGAIVVVAAAAGLVVLRRRKVTADERE